MMRAGALGTSAGNRACPERTRRECRRNRARKSRGQERSRHKQTTQARCRFRVCVAAEILCAGLTLYCCHPERSRTTPAFLCLITIASGYFHSVWPVPHVSRFLRGVGSKCRFALRCHSWSLTKKAREVVVVREMLDLAFLRKYDRDSPARDSLLLDCQGRSSTLLTNAALVNYVDSHARSAGESDLGDATAISRPERCCRPPAGTAWHQRKRSCSHRVSGPRD